MKFDELRSIAHNISDSLASGVGLLIGVYATEIFGEARRSAEGFIAVDFLTGTSTGARTSKKLSDAIAKYHDALVDLCAKHNTSIDQFRQLTTRYSMDARTPRFAVT